MNSRDPAATLMHREAAEAPGVVRAQRARNREAAAAIGARLRELAPRAVVTCARGSSDHAATYAKYLLETRLGVLTASAAPSVASVYGAGPDLAGCALLAISQSGRSPDLVATARAARDAGAYVVALVNADDSPLAGAADAVLPLHAGAEAGVAATKSFVAALAALLQLAAEWSRDAALGRALDAAPDALERAWALDWTPAAPLLERASSLFVLARGVGLAAAQEIALKCKETCGLHAEAFSGAEVRHGPQALLGGDFPALALGQDDETRAGMEALAAELAARGVAVAIAGGHAPGALALPSVAAPPELAPLLQAQAFYRLCPALALARGHDPDRPPHLRKVTETR